MNSKTKNIIISFSAFFLVLIAGINKAQAQQGNVSFQIFYDQLAPYGEWVNDPDYGYIWLPDAGQDFQPYATNGYWVNTQYGNTWYSNYDWGWAPFHYGRWIYNDYYGWGWVPGYEWGPAWVSWRQGGGQYGWAPLGPGMSFSLNINIPLRNWVFVPQRYFFNNNIHRYYTPYRRYSGFYNRTTIINNVYVYNNRNYYSGPDRRSLEQSTRNRINVREIRNSNRPGRSSINNNSVAIYRPNVSTDNNRNARPSRVVSSDNITSRPSRANTANSNSANNSATRPTNTRTTRPSNDNTSRADNNTRSTSIRNRTNAGATSEAVRSSTSSNTNIRPSRTTAPTSSAAPSSNENSTSKATSRTTTPSTTTRPSSVRSNNNESGRSERVNINQKREVTPRTNSNTDRNRREVNNSRQNESSQGRETRTVAPSRNTAPQQRQSVGRNSNQRSSENNNQSQGTTRPSRNR